VSQTHVGATEGMRTTCTWIYQNISYESLFYHVTMNVIICCKFLFQLKIRQRKEKPFRPSHKARYPTSFPHDRHANIWTPLQRSKGGNERCGREESLFI